MPTKVQRGLPTPEPSTQRVAVVRVRQQSGIPLADDDLERTPTAARTERTPSWIHRDVLERIYPKLRAIGRRLLRSDRARFSLDATEVVHDALLRACMSAELRFSSSDHLINIVARVMRQVLIDEARKRARVRPDMLAVAVSPRRMLIDVPGPRGACRLDVLALDEAMLELEAVDPKRATIAEARIFGEATFVEIASQRGVTPSAIEKRYATARAWLIRQVHGTSME